jgi:hypothetical protein
MIASSDKLAQFLERMNLTETQEYLQDQTFPMPQDVKPAEQQTAPVIEIE